jgi:hypothetical protein
MEPKDDSVEEGIAGLLDRALTKRAILNADLLITVNDVAISWDTPSGGDRQHGDHGEIRYYNRLGASDAPRR